MRTIQIGIFILEGNSTTNNQNSNSKTNDPHSNHYKQNRKFMSMVAKPHGFSIPLFVHRNVRCTEFFDCLQRIFPCENRGIKKLGAQLAKVGI